MNVAAFLVFIVCVGFASANVAVPRYNDDVEIETLSLLTDSINSTVETYKKIAAKYDPIQLVDISISPLKLFKLSFASFKLAKFSDITLSKLNVNVLGHSATGTIKLNEIIGSAGDLSFSTDLLIDIDVALKAAYIDIEGVDIDFKFTYALLPKFQLKTLSISPQIHGLKVATQGKLNNIELNLDLKSEDTVDIVNSFLKKNEVKISGYLLKAINEALSDSKS